MQDRVEMETNEYLERQAALDTIFDAGLLDIKCRVCRDVKTNKHMAFVFDHIAEGCCNDCAENLDVRIDWGLE